MKNTMNLKNRYSVVYNKPHNSNVTLYQSQVRNTAIMTVWGEDAAREAIKEINAMGLSVKRIFNGIGKDVVFALYA